MKHTAVQPLVEGAGPVMREPRIGIVVPVYKHAVLVDEAISSVLEQPSDIPFIIVAVNDGCPMPETDQRLRSWAEAHPDRVVAVRRPNGGLSAARNFGIRYLLRNCPSVEAIFMLDADNRLNPGALCLLADLLDSNPDSDWFYPQLDLFGLESNVDNGGPYSVLLHSVGNMCEAGSLVRRRVFEAGLRFDEDMRDGFEDWEFWLSASKDGFRGHPVDAPFLSYRKRPESMLAASHRSAAAITGYLKRKHRWLYCPRHLVKLEHEELPRYRIIFVDSGRVLALTDPLLPGRELTQHSFAEEVWNAVLLPIQASAGAVWVTTTQAAWDLLRNQGLLRFALWDLERRLVGVNISTLLLRQGEVPGYAISQTDPEKDDPLLHLEAAMAAVSFDLMRGVLLDKTVGWIASVGSASPAPTFSHRALLLDAGATRIPSLRRAVAMLAVVADELRHSRWAQSAAVSWSWRTQWLPPKSTVGKQSRVLAETGVLWPAARAEGSPPTVCFLLPVADFGGVENVTTSVAAYMRQRGIGTALCMVGDNPIRFAGNIKDAFDEFLWFPESELMKWNGPLYQGTRLPSPAGSSMERDLTGALAGFDAVIGCNPVGAINAFARLQQAGVVTVLYEHVINLSEYGREFGTPFVTLAYEAATDLVATCSAQMRDWLHAKGIPQSKLIAVPNAPGYPVSDDEIARVVRQRAGVPSDRPLRALFLGRFDRQKGLDRLVAIIAGLRQGSVAVDWKVVGKPVLDMEDDDLIRLKELVAIKEPVYTAEERTALFAWADVVVLPSRFEGLPLTALEAQRCGAVPVLARSGAVEEAVTSGIDGIVVSQENCVGEMMLTVRQLASDRKMLQRLSAAAAAKVSTWENSAAPFVDRMLEEVARRQNPK